MLLSVLLKKVLNKIKHQEYLFINLMKAFRNYIENFISRGPATHSFSESPF